MENNGNRLLNRENTDDKSLMKIKENSVFYKIKQFLRNLFINKKNTDKVNMTEEKKDISQNQNRTNSFLEELKNVENEETRLLKLQRKYRNGEIREEDMTEEQIDSLCKLYDKQIAELKRSNNLRKQRLLEYRKKLQM